MAHGESQNAAEHAFDVVLRGYDRRQVDDHISALEARLAATGRECAELRMQRDAEASRARDLEFRVRDGGGLPGPAAPSVVPAPSETTARGEATASSLDGFGAKVESILRVAAEEADSIRRSAETSVRKHAEAETRLRTTFESISERLQPLVSRLDEESASARAAVDGASSNAGELEAAARQQAQAMIDAASTTAAKMRADAETRVEITARQVADVREELALVRQILSSLGPVQRAAGGPGGGEQTGASPAADAPGPTAAPNAGTVRVPAMSGARLPEGAGASTQQTMPVGRPPVPTGNGSPVSMFKPADSSNPGGGPGPGTSPGLAAAPGPDSRLSHEAPTETIALPLTDDPGAPAASEDPSPGHRQSPS